MKKLLFTERMGQPIPRVQETLSGSVRAVLFQLVQACINDESFGFSFPSRCPDGQQNAGADLKSLTSHMSGFQVIVPQDASRFDEDQVHDHQIFDLLEYSYEYVASPTRRDFHSYYRHYHSIYDQDDGRARFADEVNRIFERNGVAFELREGQIERVRPDVLGGLIAENRYNTGDALLDDLLSAARERILSRNLPVRREALEKLWDAWERLKSLDYPSDKSRSVRALLDNTVVEPSLRQQVEEDAKQLTYIGNNFLIRHSEVNKPQIDESGMSIISFTGFSR